MSDIRESQLREMTLAGQALAERWGHQPWSDSWARLVAETMLKAAIETPGLIADHEGWECPDCACLNRDDEAFCFRCGAGQPEDAPASTSGPEQKP